MHLKFSVFALLILILTACGAQDATETTIEPEAERTEQPASNSVSTLSTIRALASSDEPRELDMTRVDRSLENISPFRGLYLPEQRAQYDEIYQAVLSERGVRDRYEAELEASLTALGLSIFPEDLYYAMSCAAGIDIQGRREFITPYEATYNSKYWLYSAFAELDQRNDGSVAGFPEVVPGIERFPERRRDFDPHPAVEPYREQIYILYQLERDRQLQIDSDTANRTRVDACWRGQPAALRYYSSNSFAIR